MQVESSWDVARDAEEVHALLLASDAHHASDDCPAPPRRFEATERRVSEGCVHVLRVAGEAVAMFTLTREPPFDPSESRVYPPALAPLYLSRLAVAPRHLGGLVGVQCLRRVVELAEQAGADALRSEANPDLVRVRALLEMFGFRAFGEVKVSDGRRRIYLQKSLSR